MQELTKIQAERRVFEVLVALTGMRVVADSIQQRSPPAPDIECDIHGLGPLAVELVALDAEETRVRLSNMFATDAAWKRAIRQLRPADRNKLSAGCADVHLSLQIDNTFGLRARTALMTAIQERLLEKPDGFKGELFSHTDRPLGLMGATVHRGAIGNGPRLFSPSAGSVLPPQIDKIKEKLTAKSYDTLAPLELFAYSTHDEVDSHVDAMNQIDVCVKTHLRGSMFRRVRIFDFGFGQLKYCYPPE